MIHLFKQSRGFTIASLYGHGFTLIELLIVIAILGILAIFLVFTLGTVNIQKTRDSIRKADLNTISTALEAYNFDHGNVYPPACPPDCDNVYTSETGLESWIPDLAPIEIKFLPTDPKQAGIVGQLAILFKSIFDQDFLYLPDIPEKVYAQSSPMNLQVGATNDDAEEKSLDMEDLHRSTIKLDKTTKWGGFRFTNVTIPQGATITAAHAEIYLKSGTMKKTANHYIYAEDIDDSPSFSLSFANISTRSRTTANFIWFDNNDLPTGQFIQSPDIKNIIQEVVNRGFEGNPGNWQSGNAISLLWNSVDDSSGKLEINSYDGSPSTNAVKLTIDFIPPPTPVSCSPSNQTVEVNEVANLSADDGDFTYIWSAPPDGDFTDNTADTFEVFYPSDGPKTVTVLSDGNTDDCTVEVNPPPPPAASIGATPTEVNSGETSVIDWFSSGVSSCLVTSDVNTDTWSTLSGSITTPSLTSTATYTLVCDALTDTVTITITGGEESGDSDSCFYSYHVSADRLSYALWACVEFTSDPVIYDDLTTVYQSCKDFQPDPIGNYNYCVGSL